MFVDIRKMLIESDNPSIHIERMREDGSLEQNYPEIHALIGCEQNPQFHPEGDVYTHTLMVVDEAAKLRDKVDYPVAFMLSALLHDIGKPTSVNYDVDKKKITTYDHDEIGATMIKYILSRNITLDPDVIHYVELITKNHMRPRWLYPHAGVKAFRRLASDMEGYIDDLFYLVEADTKGRGAVKPNEFDVYDIFFKDKMSKITVDYNNSDISPLVTGHDLMNQGMQPGKDIGIVLKQAMIYQKKGLNKEQIIDKINQREI